MQVLRDSFVPMDSLVCEKAENRDYVRIHCASSPSQFFFHFNSLHHFPPDYHPNFIRDNYDACKRITRGSGKAYPKKSVTYTGERPHGQFRSSSQVEDTRNERSKILPYPTFLPIPSSAAQELQTNLERATASPVVSELSSSLQESRSSSRSFTPPPQADTCTSFTIPTRTSVSALHDDHKLVPASQNALKQSLLVENGSPGRLSEESAADASAMEPRSIQEMLEVPDFPWNNKSERESNS